MTENRKSADGVDDELAFHLEMHVRRYIAEGLTPEAARARAEARLGDLGPVRHECSDTLAAMEISMERQAWWQGFWRGLWQDATYAIRTFRRAPAFAATALLMIAIGIGANTAIFSVVRAALFDSLPYPGADHVVLIWNQYKSGNPEQAAVAAAEFSDMREESHAFSAISAIRPQESSLSGDCSASADCNPERVQAYAVSPNLFRLLGVTPLMGPGFSDADGRDNAPKVIVLSHDLWQRRFGGDVSIVGRVVSVGGLARTVVGVMPSGVRFPDSIPGYLSHPADLWIPYSWEQRRTDERGNQNLAVIARVKPDLPASAAQSDLDVIAGRFKAAFPDRYADPGIKWSIQAISLRDQIVGDARTPLVILSGAAGLLLFIACANVANLLLARGSSRRHELAVRAALGAGRARLVRQLLVEALVISLAGAAAGIGIAVASVKVLVRLDPGNIPRLQDAGVSGWALAFSATLAIVTGLLIGVLPAFRQSLVDPQTALAGAGRALNTAAPRRRLRQAFVVAEVAMAVVVLVGAGLLTRSFMAVSRVSSGFDASSVLVARVTLPRVRYDTAAKVVALEKQYVDRLATVPGARHVSAAYPLPMTGEGWSGTLYVEGQPAVPGKPEPHAEYGVAMPGYFETMRIPLVEGREFSSGDDVAAARVAVVDEALAHKYWPGQSAIGKHVSQNGGSGTIPWSTVIGVVAHVRNAGPREEGEPQMYMSALQKPETSLFYVARASGDPLSLAAPARQSLRELDSSLPIANLETMDTKVARAMARDRFNMVMLSVFGAVALALAVGGLYGVISYLVTERSREIGIRLALGGAPSRVLIGILGEGLGVTSAGLVVGIVGAIALSRFAADQLFAITPTDPLTYLSIVALLLLCAAAASLIPARRATQINPLEVLRG